MIQKGKVWQASDGNFIVRKADNFIMGEEIDLGTKDSITNYKEEPYTEESYKAFYKGLGMDVPTKDN